MVEPNTRNEFRQIAETARRPVHDRRRPGRVDYLPPALIPLLRRQAPRPSTPGLTGPGRDDLRAARGLLFSFLAGILFWVVIGVLVRHFVGV
jgi:hypothetical protein